MKEVVLSNRVIGIVGLQPFVNSLLISNLKKS